MPLIGNFSHTGEYDSIIDPENLAINGNLKINQRQEYLKEYEPEDRELLEGTYIADCWKVRDVPSGISDATVTNEGGNVSIRGTLTSSSPQRIVVENVIGGLFGPKGTIPQMNLTNYTYFLNLGDSSVDIDVSTFEEPTYSPPISSSSYSPEEYQQVVSDYDDEFYDPLDGPGFLYNTVKTRYNPIAKNTNYANIKTGKVYWTDARVIEININPLSENIGVVGSNFNFLFTRFRQLKGILTQPLQIKQTPYPDDFMRCKSFFQAGKIDSYATGITNSNDMIFSMYIPFGIPLRSAPLIKVEIEEINEMHSEENVKTNYALYYNDNDLLSEPAYKSQFVIQPDNAEGEPDVPVPITIYDEEGKDPDGNGEVYTEAEYDDNGFIIKFIKRGGEKGNLPSRIKGKWTAEVLGE